MLIWNILPTLKENKHILFEAIGHEYQTKPELIIKPVVESKLNRN